MNRSILKTHGSEIARAIRNHHYEKAPSGILLPRMGIFIGGAMKIHDYRDDSEQICSIEANTLVNEGLNHALNVLLPPTGGYAQITQWYIAPFSGNYTPDASLTAATFPAAATEFTAYTNGTRLQLVVPAATTTQSTGNTGNEAQLTLNAGGPYDLYGGALVSSAAKSAITGRCLAAVRFDSPRLGLSGGDKLGWEYVLTAADAG